VTTRTDRPVALVTGANKGIGEAVAAGLARRGLRVALGARDSERGRAAEARLRDEGLDVHFVALDVDEDASVTAAVATIEHDFGRLDVVVNNAALKLERAPSPPSECALDTVRQTFETNVFGAIRVILATLPLLRRAPAPRIVNVSSGLGSLGLATTEGSRYQAKPLLSYNVSKAALNSVTVQFANELRDTECKVNSVDPGYTNTDMTRDGMTGGGTRTPAEAATIVIELATLPPGGPTGCFFDERGELPW
jgi:NAD(P)-dependent dehydrogenase (short-subunit alcohol dehydrogenase family)